MYNSGQNINTQGNKTSFDSITKRMNILGDGKDFFVLYLWINMGKKSSFQLYVPFMTFPLLL